MFNLKKTFSDEDLKELVVQLTTMNIQLDRIKQDIKDLKHDVKNTQTSINDKVRVELDTVERRYTAMLEGKLIQFDQEAAKLKGEREVEFHRLHGYFYSGGRA